MLTPVLLNPESEFGRLPDNTAASQTVTGIAGCHWPSVSEPCWGQPDYGTKLNVTIYRTSLGTSLRYSATADSSICASPGAGGHCADYRTVR
jgi:hypothetical protein